MASERSTGQPERAMSPERVNNRSEYVYFADGATGIIYDGRTGDGISFSIDPRVHDKYIRDTYEGDGQASILITKNPETGDVETFAIGDGLILPEGKENEKGSALEKPKGAVMPDIKFGERWIMGQYPVVGLLVEGPTMSKPRDGMTESDRKSPFEGAKSALYTKRYGTQQQNLNLTSLKQE